MRSVPLLRSTLFLIALLGANLLASPAEAGPPDSAQGPDVSAAVHSDVSPPLRNLGPASPSAANLRERPLHMLGPAGRSGGPDPVVQTSVGTTAATTSVIGFDGIGVCGASAGCWAPPDTNGAVGATQYVQWVNTAFAVFDKSSGAMAPGFPKAGNAVWAGFGGGCETNNDGDPIVQYDKAANRWILTQFSVSTTPYLQCVAVSTTSDATGTYNRYSFSYGTSQFNDYPKLGVWPDGYYISYNIFTNGSSFAGSKVCALNRSAMLSGAAATQQCFQLSTSYGGLLPSDLDGSTPPPAGSPNFFMNFSSNSLNLWRFHVDWNISANTTFTGPFSIPVGSFTRACNNGGTCVPQPGTTQKLDTLGDRLMYRLAYRRFTDGHEALVVNHSVAVGASLFSSGITSVRWYELRNPSGSTMAAGTPVVYQQGTLGTLDSIHRWMGSIAMDKAGDIAVGYSASNSSVYPSIRYTGRVPSDTPGTMQAETVVKAGTGSQLANLSRWGDYSAMTVDPVDDCTFWYTTEYLKTNGTWNWSTWITSFKFPGCSGAPATQAPAITSAASSTFTVGTAGSFTVTTTGSPTPLIFESGALPSGVTFVDNRNGTATLSGTPATGTAGSYPLTISATNGTSPDASQSFTLTVNSLTVNSLTITTTSVPKGTQNIAYSTTLIASGGSGTLSWMVVSGSLPNGLRLDPSTGTISGAPTKVGNFTFTVQVTDRSTPSQSATALFSIKIAQH